MKFEFFISKRYLLKGRKSSFISIISLVSIIGIAIGVAALIVALALITGFHSDVRKKILNSTAHIMISDHMSGGITNHGDIIAAAGETFPQIKGAIPVVSGTVLIRGSRQRVSGASLWGVDLKAAGIKKWLKDIDTGKLPSQKNELAIGREMSSRLNLYTGDSCLVVSPQPVLTPSGMIPRMKKMTISGVFHSGLYEIDNMTVITNLSNAQKMFSMKDKISFIQIYLKDSFQAEETASKMRKLFPPMLSIITWKDLNASLYSALKLEKTVLFFTLTLIIIVASLNIIAGLFLLVIQKIKDIGILLSYGATPKIIKRIFFIQGSIIGVAGTFSGVLIGTLFCALANRFQLIQVPYEIYQMTHVPFKIQPLDLIAVILVTLLISFTATLIPAKRASATNVVEAVKNE